MRNRLLAQRFPCPQRFGMDVHPGRLWASSVWSILQLQQQTCSAAACGIAQQGLGLFEGERFRLLLPRQSELHVTAPSDVGADRFGGCQHTDDVAGHGLWSAVQIPGIIIG